MIVPMKKAFIITQAKDASHATKVLRSLGVVHVEHQQPPKGTDLASLQDELVLIDKVIAILSEPQLTTPARFANVRHLRDWHFAAKYIADLRARLDQLEEFSRNLASRISQWEQWGDFDPDKVRSLKEKGIRIGLYVIPAKELGSLPPEAIVEEIFRVKGIVGCALITRSEVAVPFKELVLPAMSLRAMRDRLAEDKAVMDRMRFSLNKCKRYHDRFLRIKRAFEKEVELHEAVRGMAQSGQLTYLAGYVPIDQVAALTDTANRERWGIVVKDTSDEDTVPTFIKNPRWASLIEPVLKFIDIVPGYHEPDVSPVFLLFLSLFFGMIIGDAGYGALYMALTFFAHKKLGKKLRSHLVFFLLYQLSAFAIMWGLLTGTIFGQEWYLKAGFKPVLPVLNDAKFLQTFCFFIGAFHLTIGHAWQAVRKLPSLTALADIGWISVLWAAFFLARMLILDDPLPSYTRWLIIGGLTAVIFCTNPQRNILKMIGEGLGTVALSVMNNFTDVVSYVRLFAVGLAGVAISDTVNALAAGLGSNNLVGQVLVVFLGHTINVVLGPMSVLVHGIRLNVLEFSGHAGITWSGISYKPLKEASA